MAGQRGSQCLAQGIPLSRAFLGEHRPDVWASDRYGAQAGWATKAHQLCLAHLIRDVRYAIDAGDAVLGPDLKGLLKRACAIGRRRASLKGATLKAHEADLDRRLHRLLALDPIHPAGIGLRRMIRKVRPHLFVVVQNRDLEPTNNGSKRALRPCAVSRRTEHLSHLASVDAPWAARTTAAGARPHPRALNGPKSANLSNILT